jgi:hypothetical protein
MNQNKTTQNKIIALFILSFCFTNTFGQSFNDDKISMTNYVKRMYNSSPFIGVKIIEGNEGVSYYVISITLSNNNNTEENNNSIAEEKAKEAMKLNFPGPYIKFEILTAIVNDNKNMTTYLFSCQLFTDFVNMADKYFNEKKYNLALDNYNYILFLDKTNDYASERIKEITEIKNILAKRSTTVFSYKSTNGSDLLSFQNQLLEDLNLKIEKKKKGYLKLNYLISFDTSGNNLSEVKNISTSLSGYTKNLSKLNSKGILKPFVEGEYFFASQENLALDVKWNRSKILFKSKSKGIFYKKYSNQNITTIDSFINNQPFILGKYVCEIKNKEVNGKSYADINLVKYKTVGPKAVFLSMLMPGLGTMKVTYGEKGWKRFTCFLLSSGLAIGSKLYSNAQYISYLGATNQTDIDRYYNNANISHKIALISGTISATIYLNDLIGVVSKGAKNIENSRPLRKQLRKGPIQIQNQTISWD